MGAVTLAASGRKHGIMDNKRTVEVDVTFSASYATNGDTVSLDNLGLSEVTDCFVLAGTKYNGDAIAAAQITGVQVILGGTALAPKLKLYDTTAEVANATDVSTKSLRVLFVGK